METSSYWITWKLMIPKINQTELKQNKIKDDNDNNNNYYYYY